MGRLLSSLFLLHLPISWFDRLATISSSRPNFVLAARRSGGQGWPQAIAQRLALDGCEHGGRLAGSGRVGHLPDGEG